jgi:hypothetical protein
VLTLGAARQAAADTITLEWDPSSQSVGYRVHVGTSSGNYTQHVDVGSATLWAFTSAVAGQRYCFAVSAYLLSSQVEGPNSAEVCGFSNAAPTLQNPGNRTSTVGQPVTLQLVGSDPQSQPLTYSATGLPPGLSVMASTGFISGTGTTAGTYNVTARANDGTLSATQQFTWTMNAATGGGGDTTRPTATITSPTSNSSYTSSGATMNLGGSASDNVSVTQVRWANNRGGNGVASGTTSWSASGIALQGGTNVITITALDAAGNQGTDTVTVTYSGTTTPPADTTRPTISIVTPTTGTLYSTTSASLNLTGTASDNVGVAQVRWSNDRGGSGVASGTTSWGMASIPLQTGTNVVTVTALDSAGNSGTDTLSVTYSGTSGGGGGGSTGPDTTRPTISISSPTAGDSFTTSSSSLTVGGTAADNVGVARVMWSNDQTRSLGSASGTTNWSVSIPLVSGANYITVRSYDAAGNQSRADHLTVTRSSTTTTPPPTTPPPTQPPPSSSTIRLGAGLAGGTPRTALLEWTGASSPSVDVYRNGVFLRNTANDGYWAEYLYTSGRYDYRVCAAGSTTVCSNTSTVSF